MRKRIALFICLNYFVLSHSATAQNNYDTNGYMIKGYLPEINKSTVVLLDFSKEPMDTLGIVQSESGHFFIKGHLSNDKIPLMAVLDILLEDKQANWQYLFLLENAEISITKNDSGEVIYSGTPIQSNYTKLGNAISYCGKQIGKLENAMEEGVYELNRQKEIEGELMNTKKELFTIIKEYSSQNNKSDLTYYLIFTSLDLFQEQSGLTLDSICQLAKQNAPLSIWTKQLCERSVLVKKNPFNQYSHSFENKLNDEQITGIVLDRNGSDPISYANIGIENKEVGTISNEEGKFSIKIPDNNRNDSLTFSALGYEKIKISTPDLYSAKENKIHLSKKLFPIKEVTIYPSKFKIKTLGFHKPVLVTGGVTYSSDNPGMQTACFIQSDKYPVIISNIRVFIEHNDCHGFPVRIRIYSNDRKKNIPMEDILNDNEILKVNFRKGWLEADVSKYNLTMQDDFFIAVEWLVNQNCTLKKMVCGHLSIFLL